MNPTPSETARYARTEIEHLLAGLPNTALARVLAVARQLALAEEQRAAIKGQ